MCHWFYQNFEINARVFLRHSIESVFSTLNRDLTCAILAAELDESDRRFDRLMGLLESVEAVMSIATYDTMSKTNYNYPVHDMHATYDNNMLYDMHTHGSFIAEMGRLAIVIF